MLVVLYQEIGKMSGALFNINQIKYVVQYQPMPSLWYDELPSAEYIAFEAGYDWKLRDVPGKDIPLWRLENWQVKHNFPPAIKDMFDQTQATGVTVIAGHGPNDNGSLGWHIDKYDVWGFNIEGITRWSWFDLHEGKVMSQVVEPGYIISMPIGIPHKVDLITDTRVSVGLYKE